MKHDWFVGYRATFCVPYAEDPRGYGVLALRVRGDEAAIAPSVRAIREIDSNLPLAARSSQRGFRSGARCGSIR